MPARACLIVCTTCKAGRDLADGEAAPGALLHAELAQLIDAGQGEATLQPVACMANCARGCSAALAMPGKWTIFLGHLSPGLGHDLLAYATSYAAHATGTIMPSRRPESLRHAVIGRLPHLEFAA